MLQADVSRANGRCRQRFPTRHIHQGWFPVGIASGFETDHMTEDEILWLVREAIGGNLARHLVVL